MTRAARQLALVLVATMAACLPQGGWQPLPAGEDAPVDATAADSLGTAIAESALSHLRAARQRLGAPALSAAITIDGALVWAGVVGWADLARRTPASLTTEFRLGSTSKAITATALARLVDAGRLPLDSAIGRYFDRLPNRAWAPLTPRQLASHTAGIVDYATNRDVLGLWRSVRERRRYHSALAALDIFDGSGLRHPPGRAFLYSSYDVNLLGAVMERVTGRTYPQLLDSLVAAPLGVHSLHAQGAGDSVHHAVFHDLRDGASRPWRAVDHSYKWPSGGLVASPSDVARVGGAWFDTTFITRETRRAFWTPQRLDDGRVNEQSYALGWRVSRQPRVTIDGCPARQVHHGGVSKGSYSWLVLYPERRLAVSLMMNGRARQFADFAGEELALTRLLLRAMDKHAGATAPPDAACTPENETRTQSTRGDSTA